MSLNKDVLTVFSYNGHQFDFDVRDADDSEKYETALSNLNKGEESLPKTGKSSEIIRAQCEWIKQFFDDCLGKGAGEKLCTKKANIAVHDEAYDEFLEFVRAQRDDIDRVTDVFKSKVANRQQRRAEQKATKQAKASAKPAK